MLPEKCLRHVFRSIGQQRDSEKVFLFREINCVLEIPISVALILMLAVYRSRPPRSMTNPPSAVLMVKSKLIIPTIAPLARRPEDAPTAGLFENKPQPAELFVFIRAKIAFRERIIRPAIPTTHANRLRSPARSRHFLFPPFAASRYSKNSPCWQLCKLDPLVCSG